MYGLPKATELNKQLGKERFFAKFKVNSAAQQAFNADITTMYITNHLSQETVPALAAGKSVQGIYVLTLNMRHAGCNRKNLELLAKVIPQNLIFALCYEGNVQFAVFYEKLYATTLMTMDEANLDLDGANLDEVWEHLIKSIGGIVIEGDNTLAEQVEIDEARAALIKKIESTRQKAFKEKQPRRKKELIDEVKLLEKELANITK